MIWKTVTYNVEALTGEILINTRGYIRIRQTVTYEKLDFNHTIKHITNEYKRDSQQEFDFG